MKRLIFLLLLIVPMFAFSLPNDVGDSPYKDFMTVDMTDFKSGVVIVEDKVVTLFTFDNYTYDNVCGKLVLMSTDGQIFGLKYLQSDGVIRYWAVVGTDTIELCEDIWSDIQVIN